MDDVLSSAVHYQSFSISSIDSCVYLAIVSGGIPSFFIRRAVSLRSLDCPCAIPFSIPCAIPFSIPFAIPFSIPFRSASLTGFVCHNPASIPAGLSVSGTGFPVDIAVLCYVKRFIVGK